MNNHEPVNYTYSRYYQRQTSLRSFYYLIPAKNNSWTELAKGVTNADGRIPDLLSKDAILETGIYKMKFETKPYFDKDRIASFYPYVEIVFDITSKEHYHIPLLLNPFGYSTYRGS